MKKIGIIIFSLLCFVMVLKAQDTVRVRSYIRDLSSPAMFGRGSAYKGDSLAADYLKNQLKRMQVEPLSDDYEQSYGFNAFAMEGKVTLIIGEDTLSPLKDYRIAPFSKSVNQSVNILYIDPRILFNPAALATFCNKNRKILSKSFVYFDNTNIPFSNDDEKMAFQKELTVFQKRNPFCSLGVLIGVNELPIWAPSNTDFERNYALIYIMADQMNEKITKAEIHFHNDFRYHQTKNIGAMIKGTVYPDSFIVFSAHYDHIGAMGEEVIFPGAHDNASGTAMVLDFAQYFKNHPPRYSVIFLFFSGEETGLRGSSYFAKNPLIPLDKIKLMINLDLLGGGNDGIVVVNAKKGKGKDLYANMLDINEEKGLLTQIKSRDNAGISDHFPFTQRGVSAIFIYTMGGKLGGYHRVTDTSENCSLTEYQDIFKLLLAVIKN
ncbi:MAG: M28 family peptidase [Bacteroidales bacterium]